MAEAAAGRGTVVRSAVSLALVFGLLHLASTSDVLSDLTRPVVVWLLHLFGAAAVDRGAALTVGRLDIPWSRDCAGLNILVILWAVTLWVRRSEPVSARYWFALFLALPVAFAANVGRVLTLIGYRQVFFPSVESPEVHYFIGFLWLLPFLPLVLPRTGPTEGPSLLEALYFSALLSLLAPLVPAPGGSLVALCTLAFLARSRLRDPWGRAERAWMAVWLAAAAGVGVARMESLWVPWLLASPAFVDRRLLFSIPGPVLLLGTVPLVSMHWQGQAVVGAALLHQAWVLARGAVPEAEAAPGPAPAVRWALGLLLLVPFAASSLGSLLWERQVPPPGVMARPLDVNSYQVRLLGQDPDVELTWFGPYGQGRHHTLPVCMRYRGSFLHPSGEDPAVMTDGRYWMREFFLHRGDLVLSYPEYVRRTLSPLSPPWVHVIAAAPVDSMSAPSFAAVTESLARDLSVRAGGADGGGLPSGGAVPPMAPSRPEGGP